jgi:hypothetical protein
VKTEGKYPSKAPNSDPSGTPAYLKENAKTPSTFGITPPTLQPTGVHGAALEPTTAPASTAPTSQADDAPDLHACSSFGTCVSAPLSVSPDKGTGDDDSSRPLERCAPAGGSAVVPADPSAFSEAPAAAASCPPDASMEDAPASLHFHHAEASGVQRDAVHGKDDEEQHPHANTLDGPVVAALPGSRRRQSGRPLAQLDPTSAQAPGKDAVCSMPAPLSMRPEVSSPILDGIERSCGSSALARAGSSLSRTLSRHSGSLPSAAGGGSAASDAAAGAGSSYHRHQRSGALDFDAVLLTAEDDQLQDNRENEHATDGTQVGVFRVLSGSHRH